MELKLLYLDYRAQNRAGATYEAGATKLEL